MIVYVAGPASSGTRLMFDIVRAAGLRAQHVSLPGYYSQPEGGLALDLDHPSWLLPSDWGGKRARWVIMVRRPDRTAASMVRRGIARDIEQGIEMWLRAIAMLAEAPKAYWISYEAFVAASERQWSNLARWLGVKPHPLTGIYDANAKYEA